MSSTNQLNIFLLLFGGLQGVLLTTMLIQKRTYRTAYRFLIAYIIVMTLQILCKVVSKGWFMENVDFLYRTSYQLPFLYGPLVYLLSLNLRRPHQQLSLTSLLHFAPFVFAVFASAIRASFPYHSVVISLLTDVRFTFGPHLVSIVAYHYLAYREDQMGSDEFGRTTPGIPWLRTFIIISAILSLSIAIGIFLLYLSFPRLSALRWVFSGLTVFIYWISYKAISQPEFFMVTRGGAAGGPGIQSQMKVSIGRGKRRYYGSRLTPTAATAISAALNKLMITNKVYLESEISLDELAGKIGCSRHHLSQVINEKEGLSFYDYVNRFRIEEARLQLADSEQNQKIAAVAFASGFNSLSTFNDVFKKIAGMTPSDYRKQAVRGQRKQV